MKKSQNELVLDILIDEPGISQLIAGNYGVRRLASRIDELKKQGIVIHTEYKPDKNGVRYAWYFLDVVSRLTEYTRRAEGLGWRAVA